MTTGNLFYRPLDSRGRWEGQTLLVQTIDYVHAHIRDL